MSSGKAMVCLTPKAGLVYLFHLERLAQVYCSYVHGPKETRLHLESGIRSVGMQRVVQRESRP